MKSLSRKEIISQLNKLGICGDTELEDYVKNYKTYYSRQDGKLIHRLYNKAFNAWNK
jgi:hypothetical protein